MEEEILIENEIQLVAFKLGREEYCISIFF